jgi:hypothetical protein
LETIIVFVDDTAHARDQLRSQSPNGEPAQPGADGAVHWVLVACAPRMTHRISKWVSHSARENWRAKWFAKTQEQILPLLSQGGNQVTALLAKGPLAEMTRELKRRHGAACTVIDARRPKVGSELEPLTPTAAPAPAAKPVIAAGWKAPGALGGVGALFMLGLQFAE